MRYVTSHTTADILNVYTPVDPVGAMQRYFEFIQPLLKEIELRAIQLGFAQDGLDFVGELGGRARSPLVAIRTFEIADLAKDVRCRFLPCRALRHIVGPLSG